MSDSTVMLAAGGTAGHLFPAFALAQELARRSIAVELVTDMRGDKFGADFPARAIHQVPAATLKGRSPGAMAKTGLTLTRGVAAAFQLLGKVKPQAVIGFGGYPTFPPLMAARLRRIPTALHEQNAVLGRANAMLAKRVNAIATSFESVKGIDAALQKKVRFTGNPVRDAVIDWSQRAYSTPDAMGPLALLVFGGSQGARYFSEAVPPALERLPETLRRRLFIVQQCREEDLAKVEATYTAAGIRAKLATFFANLPEEMARAQLVVGRAGASTVAELTVMGRPSILVPLPHAIDNDQLANALRLDQAGGALCMEQKDLTPESLAEALARLLTNPAGLAAAASNAKALGRPDAVLRLADLVEELMGRRVASG